MKNLELKAKANNEQTNLLVESSKIHGKLRYAGELIQRDTYYSTETGRLKIREETNIQKESRAYVILYERPDVKEDKFSNYIFYAIDHVKLFLKVFGGALRQEIIVNKVRELYFYENARIHFDSVEGLGKFVEIEVVIDPDTEKAKLERDTHQIMSELVKIMDIRDQDRITCGYRELLINKINITEVRDLNYYFKQDKVFWVVNQTINDHIKANGITPCIFVEKKVDGTLAILQFDLSIKFNNYKYTAWRKFIGEEYNIKVDVLLIAPDCNSPNILQLYNLNGSTIKFEDLARSDKIIDEKFLAKFSKYYDN